MTSVKYRDHLFNQAYVFLNYLRNLKT